MKLSKVQKKLLADLNEYPMMWAECAAELEWRSARALHARGLVEIDQPPPRMSVGHFFECRITDLGRAALSPHEPSGKGGAE